MINRVHVVHYSRARPAVRSDFESVVWSFFKHTPSEGYRKSMFYPDAEPPSPRQYRLREGLPIMDLAWSYEGTPWGHFFTQGSGMACAAAIDDGAVAGMRIMRILTKMLCRKTISGPRRATSA